MLETLKSLAVASRPEFLPANLASLVTGLAWNVIPSLVLTSEFVVLLVLSFCTITVVSAFGAQVNSLSDYDLDIQDTTKKRLVKAMDTLGQKIIKRAIIVEFLLSVILISLMMLVTWKPVLLLLWAAGFFLGYAYSAPPLRLKARSWLALISLVLVLCFLPLLFVAYTFTSGIDPLFVVFLFGQALTIYSVIIPTEIRDYFGDNAMGVKTFTVRAGLVKASLLGIILLTAGGILSGSAFFFRLLFGLQPIFSISLLAIAAVDITVLRNYWKLYTLSKEYASSNNKSTAENIVTLAAHNPKWINLVMQATVFVSIILLVSRLLP
ncbi:MAG TPA: UbiA family prenyltransferase [Candidatus Krumholzibacteriaceae bacterium]|nr:UbiA family prenyltransferase [Candidatus Krumholzibacteriaceae bacterium]